MIPNNILVTGGAGFIGSHLVEELVRRNEILVVVDIHDNPLSYFNLHKLSKKTEYIKADIRDFKKIKKIIDDYHITQIFHLAAEALVENAYKNPLETMETNIIGTVNILECARMSKNIKAVVVASSDKAYGKKNSKIKTQKYLETDPLAGDHPYEVSKSSADLIAQTYFRTYNLPVTVARFGNVYGEGDLNIDRIIPGIMKACCLNQTLEIRSNGSYVRDYIYVKDVVSGYILLLEKIGKTKGGAFNFGSEDSYSVLDLISLIENEIGKKIQYRILNTAKNEISYQSLDYSKAVKILNWKPQSSLESTIDRIYGWYSEYCFL